MQKFIQSIKTALLVAGLMLCLLLPGVLVIANIIASFGTERSFYLIVAMIIGFPVIDAVSVPISVLALAAMESRKKGKGVWKAGCSVAGHLLMYELTGGSLNFRYNKDLYMLVMMYKGSEPKVKDGRLRLEPPAEAGILSCVLSCVCLGIVLAIQLFM